MNHGAGIQQYPSDPCYARPDVGVKGVLCCTEGRYSPVWGRAWTHGVFRCSVVGADQPLTSERAGEFTLEDRPVASLITALLPTYRLSAAFEMVSGPSRGGRATPHQTKAIASQPEVRDIAGEYSYRAWMKGGAGRTILGYQTYAWTESCR